MKTVLLCSIAFCTFAIPAISELTPQDIDKIRLIVKESESQLRQDIASVKEELAADISTVKEELAADISTVKEELAADISKREAAVRVNVARLEGRITGIEKQVAHATNVTYGLIALIVAAIGIPQIIIVWRSRKSQLHDEQFTRSVEQM